MRARHLGIGFIAGFFCSLLGPPPIRPEDGAPQLFVLGSEVTDFSSVAALEEYEIDVDVDRLRANAPLLSLTLPGVGLATARIVDVEHRGGGNLTWTGRLPSEAGGVRAASGLAGSGRNVVLTLENGVLSGILFLADRTFQIVPRAGLRHRLVRIDPDLFPDCAGEVTPPPLATRAFRPGGESSPEKLSAEVVIDVMVIYTPAALATAGGAEEIQATIQSAVDVTNAAYANSGIEPRLNLVLTQEIGHTEAADIALDLDWVSTDTTVAALRDSHHADLVSLMITGGTSCGIAFVQTVPDPSFESLAFQVTRLDCSFAGLSLAHELAHLQGAEHNPEDSSRWPSGASFPWSFGHYHSGAYRTVMSIPTSCAPPCPRQPYFSNAGVTFDGLPTGVTDERENYRTINATASIVAGFRARPPALFTDGFESGDTSGWTCFSAMCGL